VDFLQLSTSLVDENLRQKCNCQMQLNEIEGKGKAYMFFQQQIRTIFKKSSTNTQKLY